MAVFASMDKAAADVYFAEFMAEMDDRIEALKRQSAETGGPAAHVLDRSVGSLKPLWDWAAQHLEWRAGYVFAPTGEFQPSVDMATVEPFAELPPWFEDIPQLWAQFSAPTLWLVDGYGRYLGECLVHSIDKAKWKVGRSRVKNYVFQNHPVVGNLKALGEVDPIRTTFAFVRNQLEARPGPTPFELASRWVAAEH